MATKLSTIFSALKLVFSNVENRLALKADTGIVYSLVTRSPSPFPQHKGQPLEFGSVRLGKAYVSLHLMPIYMDPVLNQDISSELKARMQGKSCFNFKSDPDPAITAELAQLADKCLERWVAMKWI